ncbi:hypothetical protein [Alkalihalobacillus sp. AL-G]|uniref:hypothetical protein n=1 Tax=Alkalihalobacillus sp. AL-G TaxID=2926399 RepID=UPI00272C641D|nr:hypothetical protein [Alkalihalobacillus sp. AL-G]WLD94814.1 hypothetical protein MOJ78_08015 [Alkalihalobacillus sp. AL-G]
MERKPYYVTVQGGTSNGEVRGVKGSSSYDFEIIATEDEAIALDELFKEADNADTLGYFHSHFFSNILDTADQDHQKYDRLLNRIYETIYELGSDQTKADIEEMNILSLLSEEKPDSAFSTGPTMLQGNNDGKLNNNNE